MLVLLLVFNNSDKWQALSLCYSKQRKIDAPSWQQSFDKAAVIFCVVNTLLTDFSWVQS